MLGSEMYLNEDEALLVETVTRFVSDEVTGEARSWEKTGIPKQLWASLGELGLLAIITPESSGGAGLGLRDLGLVAGHLAQGDLALAWALVRHNQAVALLAAAEHPEIETYLTGQERLDWTDKDQGHAFGCDAQVVVSATELRLLKCEPNTASSKPIGARGLGIYDVETDDTLGTYEREIDLQALASASSLYAACVAWGLGVSALKAATDYALERQQFGKPIAQFQAIQWKLADGSMLLQAAELLTEKALAEPQLAQSAMAYKASIDAVTKLVDDGLQTHGGYGYTEDFDIEKYYRDAQFLAAQLGTRRGQSLKLAQDILNHARN